MDIRILKYFLAVVQAENLTRAAEMLHTSQPNLSRQIAELEEEVGCTLFKRGSRRITLTEEGMFLSKRAMEITGLLERTESDMALFNTVTSGDVYIGAAETYTMRLLADVILVMRRAYPQIQYHFFSGSTIEVTEQLDKGLCNFAILVEPIDIDKYEYLRFPVNDLWGVLMNRRNPLAAREFVRPEDLLDQPLFCSRQMLDGNVLTDWFGPCYKKLNIAATFNLITNPAIMIAEGFGCAFTFDRLVNTEGSPNLCFRPLEPRKETGLYFAWKKYPMFSKAAKVFLEQMRLRVFKNLEKENSGRKTK